MPVRKKQLEPTEAGVEEMLYETLNTLAKKEMLLEACYSRQRVWFHEQEAKRQALAQRLEKELSPMAISVIKEFL